MTAPQGQGWSHRPGCEGHDHEHVRDGYGRIIRTRCLVGEPREPQPWEHDGHKPTQHRDGKPPWCNACGWSSPVPAIPAQLWSAR